VIEPLADSLDESSGDEQAMWHVMGTAVNPSQAAVGTGAAGDRDVFVLSPDTCHWA
jgi:hypothetical protein